MDKINIPSEYRGLKVIRKHRHKLNGINASYDNKTKTIILYDRWTKRTDLKRESILYHEYCHYIYMNKINRITKLIWALISNGKLITILNIFGITGYTKNAYISNHAERNYNEDFAHSCEEYFLKTKNNNYTDTKMKLANAVLRYFTK